MYIVSESRVLFIFIAPLAITIIFYNSTSQKKKNYHLFNSTQFGQ